MFTVSRSILPIPLKIDICKKLAFFRKATVKVDKNYNMS